MLDLVSHPLALACLGVFLLSYLVVLFEEKTHLKKSKPVMLGAGLIWILIAALAQGKGIDHDTVKKAIFHGLEEYAALLLFLLSAMTYIAALQNRGVFDALRGRLVSAGLNKRQLFWATGVLAFCLSPVADNLTTALVTGAIIVSVGQGDRRFISAACVNAVNAANAGGAFSPFGDITTLMVWQAGHVDFFSFFKLIGPALACFIVPAAVMSLFVPSDRPAAMADTPRLKPGAWTIVGLGIFTILLAVGGEQLLGLPPFMGMMTGMSLLMITAWWLQRRARAPQDDFDVMELIASVEWDTLLFFFGIIFGVGGLAFLGYLTVAADTMYAGWGATAANITVGLASAVFDNIPLMFAVLRMNLDMSQFQWLLITLTAGVGGSLLSVGSAAGVALMGVARGQYTFLSHLRWTPILLLGYAAAVGAHFLLNGG